MAIKLLDLGYDNLTIIKQEFDDRKSLNLLITVSVYKNLHENYNLH